MVAHPEMVSGEHRNDLALMRAGRGDWVTKIGAEGVQAIGIRSKGMGIAIADFNDDGWMDVFIANDTERNFLFLNQGNGAFKEAGLLYGVAYNESGVTVSSRAQMASVGERTFCSWSRRSCATMAAMRDSTISGSGMVSRALASAAARSWS